MANVTHSVLFRYFFFQWMFRDANVSELYQRSAALRHNRAHRHHLKVYLWRWVVVALLMYGLGAILEILGVFACVFFYTVAALAACTISKIAVAYLMLGSTEHP
ncbi:hypothetical protein [Limnobacter sp.]|uniref:hypothetical protein n=1 Tax=Limnobacter sp. TaxID=2003368 RepID=UPI003513A0A0